MNLWSLLLLPVALTSALSAYVPFGSGALKVTFGVGALGTVALLKVTPIARPLAPESRWTLAAAIVLVTLGFLPMLRLPIAPGADQAMYSAIARGMTDGMAGLNPAWGPISPQSYPRGYPVVLAALTPIVGVATASLVAGGIALVGYGVALGFLFKTLGLGKDSFGYAVAVALICRVPQIFFGSGSSATTLGAAWGLAAGAHLLRAGSTDSAGWVEQLLAALFALAGLATHPIGAMGGLGAGAMCLLLPSRGTRWTPLFPIGGAVLLGAMAMQTGGPWLSVAELEWIRNWTQNVEGVFRPLALNVVGMLRSGADVMGPAAAGLLAVGAAFGIKDRGVRALAIMAVISWLAFIALEWTGSRIPVLRGMLYPYRLLPGLVVLLALPGLTVLQRVRHRGLHAAGLGALLAVGVASNWVYYQSGRPMATGQDLEAIRCLDRKAPPRAAIDGAYGDATQWIPALTGRAITQPHVHVSLQDEYLAMRSKAPILVEYRFVGSTLRYGVAISDSAETAPLCRAGKASAVRLLEPIKLSR